MRFARRAAQSRLTLNHRICSFNSLQSVATSAAAGCIFGCALASALERDALLMRITRRAAQAAAATHARRRGADAPPIARLAGLRHACTCRGQRGRCTRYRSTIVSYVYLDMSVLYSIRQHDTGGGPVPRLHTPKAMKALYQVCYSIVWIHRYVCVVHHIRQNDTDGVPMHHRSHVWRTCATLAHAEGSQGSEGALPGIPLLVSYVYIDCMCNIKI